MNLSHVTHLKNKYPGGRVDAREDSIDAFCADGRHRVALRKDGAGGWQDMSKALGAEDSFCLAPIPKESRQWKQYAKHVGPAEEHQERKVKAAALARDGKVPSLAQLEAEAKAKKAAEEAEAAKQSA